MTFEWKINQKIVLKGKIIEPMYTVHSNTFIKENLKFEK